MFSIDLMECLKCVFISLGLVSTVLVKEGQVTNVADLVSGAFKVHLFLVKAWHYFGGYSSIALVICKNMFPDAILLLKHDSVFVVMSHVLFFL